MIQTTSIPDQETPNETSDNKSDLEAKSRSLQRAAADCNDGYFIDDRSEININFQKYRMVFVVNKDAVFYKKCALRQARIVSIDLVMLLRQNQ